MEQNICKSLGKKWKDLESELPQAQMIVPGRPFEVKPLRIGVFDELDQVRKELKDKCWYELSAADMSKLDPDRWLKDLREGNNPRIHGKP